MSNTADSTFIAAVQARTARVAVGPSAVRKQGKGCAKVAREFFERLDLSQFSTRNAEDFRKVLDKETNNLQAAFPKESRHWGLARKLLNIFLRDSLYTGYLQEAYKLALAEPLLELPLDSITAKQVKKCAGRGKLSAWPGVKNLRQDLSIKLQAAAESEAKKRKIARVHLDTFWWGKRDAP